MTTIVSWNIAQSPRAWQQLLDMDADIALLQEAAPPPEGVRYRVWHSEVPWETPGLDAARKWRAAVVRLSDRVKVEWIEAKSPVQAEWGGFVVSRPGTLEAARVTPLSGDPFIVCSMYGLWTGPLTGAGSWIMADNSVHRIISDLSVFIGRQDGHRIICAGDLNILHGHGENGSKYWAARYQTVFDRMEAIGVPYIGPQIPNGRQADPWPQELPPDSKNVPTFYSTGTSPVEAYRQLDHVFASRSLVPNLTVRALNGVEEWGASDHCRVLIEVAER